MPIGVRFERSLSRSDEGVTTRRWTWTGPLATPHDRALLERTEAALGFHPRRLRGGRTAWRGIAARSHEWLVGADHSGAAVRAKLYLALPDVALRAFWSALTGAVGTSGVPAPPDGLRAGGFAYDLVGTPRAAPRLYLIGDGARLAHPDLRAYVARWVDPATVAVLAEHRRFGICLLPGGPPRLYACFRLGFRIPSAARPADSALYRDAAAIARESGAAWADLERLTWVSFLPDAGDGPRVRNLYFARPEEHTDAPPLP